jgi:hypothetical protein
VTGRDAVSENETSFLITLASSAHSPDFGAVASGDLFTGVAEISFRITVKVYFTRLELRLGFSRITTNCSDS